MGCCSTRAQARNAGPVVFRWILTGEHVYRVHPINVQLVIMAAKEEHGCNSG